MRVLPISGKGARTADDHLRDAIKHNKREHRRAPANVDESRSSLNLLLEGGATADDVLRRARELVGELAFKRKDSPRAFEYVISLPAGSAIDPRVYFGDALRWIKHRHNLTVLSADVHLDEGAPHCHVLLSPVRDGRLLRRDDVLGGRSALQVLGRDFAREVASRHGLKAPKAPRGSDRIALARLVLANLRDDPGKAWQSITAAVMSDPAPFAAELGIEAPVSPNRRLRTSTAIFTSAGKGPKREPFAPAGD